MVCRPFAIASLVLVVGCSRHVETPVTRACLAVGGGDVTSRTLLERCRCLDGIAQRQLDDRTYARVAEIAETFVDRRGAVARLEAAANTGDFVWSMGGLEGAITAADLVVLTGKVATRCN